MRKEADRIALEGLEERLATLQQTAEQQINDLQSELGGAESRAEALEGTVSDLKSKIAELMEQLKQRGIEVNEVQASKDELEAMCGELREFGAVGTRRALEMDGEVKRLEGEVDEVRSQQQQQVMVLG